jgi:hypothetical protein
VVDQLRKLRGTAATAMGKPRPGDGIHTGRRRKVVVIFD